MHEDVLIAVPTRGAIHWQTVQRLQEIRDANPGVPPVYFEAGNLSVARTRNKIVQHFLAGPWQTLIMVDDDVVPPPHMLEALLPVAEGYGMVGIPHVMPHPSDRSKLLFTAFDEVADGGLRPADISEGWTDVDALATGCVAIPRAAFAVLREHPFHMSDDPTERPESDDFFFCRDLRAQGFKLAVWYDGWYCDHLSTVQLAPLMQAQRERSFA